MGGGTDVAGKSSNKKKRSVAAGLGLGAASMLTAQNAEAAQQVADLAAGDNRVGILATLAVPAIGWVLFNILGER
jgi:photosystem II PsbY protein